MESLNMVVITITIVGDYYSSDKEYYSFHWCGWDLLKVQRAHIYCMNPERGKRDNSDYKTSQR